VTRKILLGLCAAAAVLLVLPGASASAKGHAKVGPNQLFAATVNGQSGVTSPAVIRMACFGPVVAGQTGHPMAEQTVEVFRPEAIVAATGLTGPTTTYIQAFFGVLPPSPAGPGAGSGADVFTRYGVPEPIPTSLLLPCGGTGNVYFVPLPMVLLGPGRIATVHVAFVGQP
jgi:hypothetical protein